MTNTQTTFARVTLGYDKAHERAPVEDNTEAIFETSRMPISADHLVRQIEQQSIAATATMKERGRALSQNPAKPDEQ
jgi:hypothetical protein